MKVIYAGYSKCGTKTMRSALTELGYEVYDFMENYEHLGDDWEKIFTTGGTTEDFRRMFENVDAVTDVPGCFFWEEIHRAFPEAKIVWSKRETEDIWFNSFQKQLKSNDIFIIKMCHLLSPSCMKMNEWGIKMCKVVFGFASENKLFKENQVNELMARKFYRMHNSYLENNAPKDKLHVVDFKNGWGPLCDFLGVPVPNKPFPHANKGASITQEMLKTEPLVLRIQREMKLSAATIVLVVGFCGYKLATRPSDFAKWAKSVLSYSQSWVEKLK